MWKFWQYPVIELYWTSVGWPDVWIAPSVSCHCPVVNIACLYSAQHCKRLCIFLRTCWGIRIQAWTPISCRNEQRARHLPLSTVCPDAFVTAHSATSTAETQTCLVFCSTGLCILPATLMSWLYMLHFFFSYSTRSKAQELALTNSTLVTYSEQLVWTLGSASFIFISSFEQCNCICQT